jgi:hypothetical protein
VNEFEFSDDTLFRVQCLIKHIGGADNINPHHDDTDNSVGAFMMFVIRDALIFGGLLSEKKSVPAREIKIALHKFQLLTSKSEYLSKEIARLEE